MRRTTGLVAALAIACAVLVAAIASAPPLWVPPADRAPSAGGAPAALGDFGDGTWILRVDRAWDGWGGGIALPPDPIAEADYRSVADGPTYAVTVTQGTSAVAIGEPPLRGARIVGNPDMAYYELDQGTFAGGRFVVWAAGDGLQAELTIYGSGRPIIRSERGVLERTYHVATGGSNEAGTGTIDRPWATIAHALNAGVPAAGGATVVVHDGVYRGMNTVTRGFPVTVTVQAARPYRTTLTNVDGGAEALRVYVNGPARLVVTGFMLTNRHPTYGCDGGRETMYLVHLADASAVTLRDNILVGNNAPGTCNELLKINRSDPAAYPKDITIRGNVFSEPANAPGADMIDAVRPGEVDIFDNVFFSAPERDRSQSFITLKRQAPATGPARQPRYRIARNVFLSWGGRPDQAFVQLGEDGVPEHEITDAVIENNLFLGDSPARMAAPIQLKGVRGIVVRANTTVGDLPSGAYGLRAGTEGENPPTGDVRVDGNIWSDPTGTMGARFVTAYGDVDLASILLAGNLFWNAGRPLPAEGAVTPDHDATRIVADPLLPDSGAGVVLPVWDPAAGAFASGARTIRAEFLRLVEAHAAPGAGSPVVDAADPARMPADDIRHLPRDTRSDIGAYEVGAGTPTATPTATAGASVTPASSVTPTPTTRATPPVGTSWLWLPVAAKRTVIGAP